MSRLKAIPGVLTFGKRDNSSRVDFRSVRGRLNASDNHLLDAVLVNVISPSNSLWSERRRPKEEQAPVNLLYLMLGDPSAEGRAVGVAEETLMIRRLLRAGPACLRDLADLAEDFHQALDSNEEDECVMLVEEARLCVARSLDHASVPEVEL